MANKQIYELTAQSSPQGTDVVPSQPAAGGVTVKVTIAKFWDRANHTGTQLMATISDAGDSATKNVGTSEGTVAAGDHLHDDRYYTESELDGGQLDNRYYTENELDTALAGKSDTSHNHSGVYEPADAGIQTHLASTSNPHSVSTSQIGAEPALGNPSVDGQVLSSTTGGTRSWITVGGMPVGTVCWFADDVAPSGTLECDGSAISRTTYADLFAVIGTTWGVGDGSTTFNIPDLRGEFIRGWDHGRGVDSGRAFASYQADAYKSHTHTYHEVVNYASSYYARATDSYTWANSGNTGSSGGTETRPRNKAMLPLIKY